MKDLKISTALGIIFAAAIWTSFLQSCKGGHSAKQLSGKKDTTYVSVIYRFNGGNIVLAQAKYIPGVDTIFDKPSMQAKFVSDTSWLFLIPNVRDTIKDVHNKPMYDTLNHTFRFNNQWIMLTPDDKSKTKIQVITI